MRRISRTMLMASFVVLATSCGRRGERVPEGVKVDLVSTWGLDRVRKVVLKAGPWQRQHAVLSSAEQIREFFADFKNAIEGGYKYLTVIGSFEMEMEGETNFWITVLVDRGREWKSDQVAVQRLGQAEVENYYYLPDRFLKRWEKRFGRLRYSGRRPQKVIPRVAGTECGFPARGRPVPALQAWRSVVTFG